MKIKAVLFDLDGTLLPMEQDVFAMAYFKSISAKLAAYGYDQKQLIDTILKSTYAMVKNTGEKTNEDVFWNVTASIYGDKILTDKPIFDEYYENDFDDLKRFCGFNPKAAETVRKIKEMGCKTAVATNPVFPKKAIECRIKWAGLSPEDFEFYTTYDSINFCKPQPQYYNAVAKRIGVDACECLMVGNDVGDDMPSQNTGMQVFLLTDCLINKSGEDISKYPNGSFDDLIEYIKSFE